MIRLRRGHEDTGFSLVELAVYIVLLGIVGTIVATVIPQAFRSEQVVADVTEVSSQSQNFSTLFRRDMANANLATVPSSTTVTLCAYPTNSATTRANITWSLANQKVTRTVAGGTEAVIIDGIDAGGAFTLLATNRVGFNFTVTSEHGAPQTVQGTSSYVIQSGGSTC